MPRGEYPHFEGSYGWKRRCEDFAEGTPEGIEVERVDLVLLLGGK